MSNPSRAQSQPLAPYGLERMLLAVLGFCATMMPVWWYGASSFALWPVVSALVLLAFNRLPQREASPHSPFRHEHTLLWLTLMSMGLLYDFSTIAPDSLLALCRSVTGEFGGLSDLVLHWQRFPASAMIMAHMVWIKSHDVAPGARRPLLAVNALRSVLLLAVLHLTMNVFEAIASALGQPFTADGVSSAMICGMLLFGWVAQQMPRWLNQSTVSLKD